MPTVIDSLFLELGIDTSKFSADQKKALDKIQKFESQTKRAADKAAGRVKKVGEAFRDIANDSAIGASAKRLDAFSIKLRALGQAGRVNGGVASPIGAMAEGLGALLSPATLALAAVSLLGKGVWDFDKKMTATNATIFRQAQLSGMNAKNLWAWGEAAKTVGASPESVTSGIAGLQTAVTGMGIGAGNATAQLVALARLGGVGWNFKSGVDIPQLFERVHELAKKNGYRNLGALRSLTSPLMNDAMWNIATNPNFNPDKLQSYIKHLEPQSFGKILAGAVKSQQKLGLLGVSKDTLMERAYGATRNVFDAMAVGIQQLVGYVSAIWNFLSHPASAIHHAEKVAKSIAHGAAQGWKTGGAWGAMGGAVSGYKAAVNAGTGKSMLPLVRTLMANGLSRKDAMAMAGNMMQESSLNPSATTDYGAHMGLAQWDRARQRLFRKMFHYRMGSGLVPAEQQIQDQAQFAVWELHNTSLGRQALEKMRAAKTLQAKTLAADAFYERSGEVEYSSLLRAYGILGPANLKPTFNRIDYAQDARAAMKHAHAMVAAAHAGRHTVTNTITNHTRTGDIHVHTPATDPQAHAAAVRKGLSTHPLIGPGAQHQVILSTTANAG